MSMMNEDHSANLRVTITPATLPELSRARSRSLFGRIASNWALGLKTMRTPCSFAGSPGEAVVKAHKKFSRFPIQYDLANSKDPQSLFIFDLLNRQTTGSLSC